MSFELGVLPSGHLHCFLTGDENDADAAPQHVPIAKAFTRSATEGLFALAAGKSGAGLSPSLVFWRSFAANYLKARCHLTQTDPALPDPIEPLSETDAASLHSSAPPMR
ncbi:MAG: hypothetical protein GY731_05290, partial [Gammaproteobacteria bacterium]|nr:hypothetical protein [Gammaproteobacteria bacterium]